MSRLPTGCRLLLDRRRYAEAAEQLAAALRVRSRNAENQVTRTISLRTSLERALAGMRQVGAVEPDTLDGYQQLLRETGDPGSD